MSAWNPDDPFDWKFRIQPTPPVEPASSALVKAMMGGIQSTPSPTAPEKSLIQKLQDTVTQGRKFLQNNKKPAKDILIQKVRQIRFLLFSLFGKETTIVKNLDLFLKEASTKGLLGDQFAQILSDIESLSDFLGKASASSLSCQISQTS